MAEETVFIHEKKRAILCLKHCALLYDSSFTVNARRVDFFNLSNGRENIAKSITIIQFGDDF